MDPLSISVAIFTLLGAAGKVGEGLQKLYRLTDAPDELATLINEVRWI